MELSTDWISEFELEDKDYKQFYKEKVNSVKVYFLYVNKEHSLFHVKKNKIKLSNSKLPKEELIQLLKQYRIYEKKEYIPLSILKYNLTLQPQNIRDFIYDKYNKSFLTAENSIDEITWYDSILFLQDINSLYIVFREKWKKNNHGTKKIYIKSKKLKRSKTRKKRLKDTQS
jgi:hypothetical protein